jgi:hypothetical protein
MSSINQLVVILDTEYVSCTAEICFVNIIQMRTLLERVKLLVTEPTL